MTGNFKRILPLILTGFAAFILNSVVLSCESFRDDINTLPVFEQGKLNQADDGFGPFYYFIPPETNRKTRILVLAHGTPMNLSPIDSAFFYAKCWQEFALDSNYILLAPAFNQEDFSSRYGDRAQSGYRGLFGRRIGADERVIRLVEVLKQDIVVETGSIDLYGHSAGGQFVARFLVMHPEAVGTAVITSAATYPQPSAETAWPFGMGELHTDILWDDGTIVHADVVPEMQKWLSAARIPLTVIVGLNDTEELPKELIPGQKGDNRYAIAANWINDMHLFAEEHGIRSNFRLELIPGIGHSMSRLLPYSMRAITDYRQ